MFAGYCACEDSAWRRQEKLEFAQQLSSSMDIFFMLSGHVTAQHQYQNGAPANPSISEVLRLLMSCTTIHTLDTRLLQTVVKTFCTLSFAAFSALCNLRPPNRQPVFPTMRQEPL